MTVIWAFLRSRLGLEIVGGVVALITVILLVNGIHGRWVKEGVTQEQKAEAVRLDKARAQIARRETNANAISDKAKTAVAVERVRVETVTRTLTKEVPVYVTRAADDRCVVPVGFVRLHDAAAAGSASLPKSSGGSGDAASGVQLSAVADTLIANYGVAYGWRAEAQGWRDWYAKQKAAWDKP